ncbi:MAG: DUF3828 domain-containing protein [Asticcacaulis sp.]|nr:DUF3828 domain-containing protein [Asticcacaulis sp.]
MRHLFFAAILAAPALASPAFAELPDSPSQIVGKLYAPYLTHPHASSEFIDKSAIERVRPFASAAFAAAIDKDQACMEREQGICNLDWDVIINGQDWEVSNFAIEGDGATVRAHFVNFESLTVTYHFIREGDVWKIDDIENLAPDSEGKATQTISIKDVLNQ